jgi:hypothetical protein
MGKSNKLSGGGIKNMNTRVFKDLKVRVGGVGEGKADQSVDALCIVETMWSAGQQCPNVGGD